MFLRQAISLSVPLKVPYQLALSNLPAEYNLRNVIKLSELKLF